jgi:hypothetical protein
MDVTQLIRSNRKTPQANRPDHRNINGVLWTLLLHGGCGTVRNG